MKGNKNIIMYIVNEKRCKIILYRIFYFKKILFKY